LNDYRQPAPAIELGTDDAIIASTVGTTIEWYDFFLYSTVTGLVFAKLYFPNSDPLTGTLQAFAIYAVGFVARPVGAAIFGHYGDRIGRKSTLIRRQPKEILLSALRMGEQAPFYIFTAFRLLVRHQCTQRVARLPAGGRAGGVGAVVATAAHRSGISSRPSSPAAPRR